MRANLVTGASDCDPSAVVTSLHVGATTGFSLVWMFPLTTLALIWMDARASRLGTRQGIGITRLLRQRVGPPVAAIIATAFVAANVITVTADISGAASAASDLVGVPRWSIAISLPIIPAVLLYSLDFARVRSALLLVVPLFALYLVAAIAARPMPSWHELLPQELSGELVLGAIGLVGAVLTPYVFFWQVEDSVQMRARSPDVTGVSYVGMVFANLVLLAIVATAASVLYAPNGGAASPESLRAASDALEPLLGSGAFACFSIGLIASTVVGTPVIAAASGYAVIGPTVRRAGLNWPVAAARGFYFVAFGVLSLGGLLALVDFNAVALLFWAQVTNGALVPVLIAIFLLAD